MNNMAYVDKDVKKEFLKLVKENLFIGVIIDQVLRTYTDIVIMKAIYNDKGFEIKVHADEEVITINSNYLRCETVVMSSNWNYWIVYSNLLKKNYEPLGKEYFKENRRLLLYERNALNPHKYLLGIENNGKYDEYEISIKQLSNNIDDKFIVENLLDNNASVASIKDLLRLINQLIDLGTCEVKIQCKTDEGSIVIVFYGILTKYVEYFKQDNTSVKRYLEDDTFYDDITITQEVGKDYVPYLKKKGKYNE